MDTPDPGDPAALIHAYIVDSFLLGADDLDDDDSLIGAGIVDSTGVMEIVEHLEATFGIEIDDDDLVQDNLDSVKRLVAFVARKRAAPGTA
jgi:acyl carrier protein